MEKKSFFIAKSPAARASEAAATRKPGKPALTAPRATKPRWNLLRSQIRFSAIALRNTTYKKVIAKTIPSSQNSKGIC